MAVEAMNRLSLVFARVVGFGIETFFYTWLVCDKLQGWDGLG
jgi:hypothetical protein